MEIWRRFCRRFWEYLGILFLGSVYDASVIYVPGYAPSTPSFITCKHTQIDGFGSNSSTGKSHAICAEHVPLQYFCMQDADFLVNIFYASKLWKHSPTQRHVRGKLPRMTTTRCLVKTRWHQCDFLLAQIFLRLKWNSQTLPRFTKHAKVVFPTASDGKGLAAGQKELRTAPEKGRVFGEFGSFWGWQA